MLIYKKILKDKNIQDVFLYNERTKTINVDEQALIDAENYYLCLKTVNWEDKKSLSLDEEEILLYMKKRGFYASTLNFAGMKYTYNKNYPIIFPILDQNIFKGYVCRTTNKLIEKKRKYLYNKGFSRQTTLCGKHTLYKKLIVVEGFLDRLKFIQYGYKNAVAIFGWKATDYQLQQMKNKNIICATDNDDCGEKGYKYLKSIYPNTKRLIYPQGIKDAGDLDLKKIKMLEETICQF